MANKTYVLVALFTICITWSRQTPLEDVSSPTPKPDSITDDQDRLARSINEFGYKLILKSLQKNQSQNVVLSPTGVAGLLAMTLLGTVGKAYDELADALGFSQDILSNRQNHEQFGQLLRNLNSDDLSRTIYADSIVVDTQLEVRQVYRDYLQRVYGGGIFNADFTDAENTTELVNEWVKNNTNGKIENFLKQPLSPLSKVVLLSALYFSGQWAQPFLVELTRPMPFKTPSGDVTTDFMVNAGHFKYAHDYDEGYHIIAIPYNDSVTTMYALKPFYVRNTMNQNNNETEPSLLKLMENLNYSKINDIINKMNASNCVIRFPKMDLKNEVNLVEYLQDLGVKSIFSQTSANFALMINDNRIENRSEDELITRINSRIAESPELKEQLNRLPNPGVFVNSVLHSVKMTVNEFGTEAVAASSAFITRSAELFYADSPFYLFIRNERTKLVTFSAVILDPSK